MHIKACYNPVETLIAETKPPRELVCPFRAWHLSRAILRETSNLRAVDIEQDRHREQRDTQEPQQRGRPRDAEVMEHARGKHGKASTEPRTEEGVGGDGGVGVHGVAVDDVV